MTTMSTATNQPRRMAHFSASFCRFRWNNRSVIWCPTTHFLHSHTLHKSFGHFRSWSIGSPAFFLIFPSNSFSPQSDQSHRANAGIRFPLLEIESLEFLFSIGYFYFDMPSHVFFFSLFFFFESGGGALHFYVIFFFCFVFLKNKNWWTLLVPVIMCSIVVHCVTQSRGSEWISAAEQ